MLGEWLATYRRLAFETQGLTSWDSGFVTFLRNVAALCAARQITFDRSGLPEGVRRRLMEGLTDTSKMAQTTLTQTQRRLDQDPVKVLQEVAAAARAIRLLADTIERNPSILVYGKGGGPEVNNAVPSPTAKRRNSRGIGFDNFS